MSDEVNPDERGSYKWYDVWHHDGDERADIPCPRHPDVVEACSFTDAAEIFAADDFGAGEWRSDEQRYAVRDEEGRIALVTVTVEREPSFNATEWDYRATKKERNP